MVRQLHLLAPVLAVALWACGSYPAAGPAPGEDRPCRNDFDCNGARICVDGVCRDPHGGSGGSGGDGGGGAGGSGDCIELSVSCGCDGRGYGEGVPEFAFFTCNDAGSVSITDGVMVVATDLSLCSGQVRPCELQGLGRLMDESFLGCVPAAGACEGASAFASFYACNLDDVCAAYPSGTGACGERELQQALNQIRDRVLAEGSCDVPPTP